MKIKCLCENQFEITPVLKVDLDKNPGYLEKIKSGDLNLFTCPVCKSHIRPDVKVELTWKSKDLNLIFIPESLRFECLSFCTGHKHIDFQNKSDKPFFDETQIPVIGFTELSDRVKVIDAGLVPEVIEFVKFITIDNAKGRDKKEIDIFFNKVSNDQLEFLISGLKEKEIAVINIPKAMYDNIFTDYKKNKQKDLFNAMFLGSYLSYKNIALEE